MQTLGTVKLYQALLLGARLRMGLSGIRHLLSLLSSFTRTRTNHKFVTKNYMGQNTIKNPAKLLNGDFKKLPVRSLFPNHSI